MPSEIQLLQFFICQDFRQEKQDFFNAHLLHSNLYVVRFPCHLRRLTIVTCWRKDRRFHKEVIEYETDYGAKARSPHMDVEPISNSVLFRWHKHPFPTEFHIAKPTTLTIRVLLDRIPRFASQLLIERRPA